MSGKSIAKIARHDRIRREVLSRCELIPSLPEVVTEVLRMLNEADCDIHAFEQPLSKDAALVAKMLKLVNSSFYGVGRPVTAISDAVVMLGLRSLRSMVLAASTANLLERDFACYGHHQKGLWYHSLCVAAASRCLAKELGYGPNLREEVFVAGLLHDIGKMLLGPFFVAEKADIGASDRPAHEIEAELFGIDHQEAGAIIAGKWQLSPLVQAVLNHHDTSDGPSEYERAITVVHLANTCAHRARHGYRSGVVLVTEPTDEQLDRVGLDAGQWEDLIPQLTETMDGALRSLGDIGGGLSDG